MESRRIVDNTELPVWSKKLYADLEELHDGKIDVLTITIHGKTYTVVEESYYNSLEKDSTKLSCLECAGVDNWSGWDYAMEEFLKEYPDD